MQKMRGTTIVAVKHKGKVTVAGDGQVTLDVTVMKHGARKVRRLYHDEVIVGFAGTTADAFTLFDRFDSKLEQYNGNLLRAAVELTKDWRTGPDSAASRSPDDCREQGSFSYDLRKWRCDRI